VLVVKLLMIVCVRLLCGLGLVVQTGHVDCCSWSLFWNWEVAGRFGFDLAVRRFATR
jgi:hypothetical protein